MQASPKLLEEPEDLEGMSTCTVPSCTLNDLVSLPGFVNNIFELRLTIIPFRVGCQGVRSTLQGEVQDKIQL